MAGLKYHRIEASGVGGRCGIAGDAKNPPLVLLATPLAGIAAYGRTIEFLARDFRVFAIELPGCAFADRLSHPWSLHEYARWVNELLAVLDVDRVILVGHSLSGGIALLCSALYPTRLAHVVVADGIGLGGPYGLFEVVLGRLIDTLITEKILALKYKYYFLAAFAHLSNYLHQVRVSLESDLRRHLPSIHIPLLLAWGARDHTIPFQSVKHAASQAPNAKVYLSQKGSHCWAITHAREFATAVLAWTEETNHSTVSGNDLATSEVRKRPFSMEPRHGCCWLFPGDFAIPQRLPPLARPQTRA